MVSKRIQKLQPSPTLSLDAQVKQLQSEGQHIINLGLGEPDFTTPLQIRKAAITAIENGFTHYTITAGILPLREAICKKLLEDNNVQYAPSEIVVGVGTKQLLYHAFQVLCNEGDEVVVHLPTWSTYIEQIKLSGAIPVVIPLQSPFVLTANDVAKKITKKTKVILLNSPANPTGAMMEKNELKKIAKLATQKRIYVVSDEIYEKISFGKRHTSIASLGKEIKKLTITINGFSKSYAMTGWRIGYAAGPQEIISAMISLQTQTTSGTSSISQKAAIRALSSSQKPLENMRREFEKRRGYLTKELSKIKGISFTSPEGAFYFFVDISQLLKGQLKSSQQWCQKLLEEEQVSVVPGEAFLHPNCFRLSFATSMEDIQKGVKKIINFISHHS
jgi:aspartate aminotransferase